MSPTRVDLPEPDTPVTTVSNPKRKRHIDRLSNCDDARLCTVIALPFGAPAFVRHRNLSRAANVKPGDRVRIVAAISSAVPNATSCTAMRARAWPKIDDVIRAPNRFFIVLDDEHGVAEIAQRGQRIQQSFGCRADAVQSRVRRERKARRAVANRFG